MKNLIRKSVEAMDGYVPGEQPKGVQGFRPAEDLEKSFGLAQFGQKPAV